MPFILPSGSSNSGTSENFSFWRLPTQMELKMKKTHFLLPVLLSAAAAGFSMSMPNFSGNMGVLGDLTFTPNINADAYFAGQIDFSDKVIVRTDFSVQTTSIQNLLSSPTSVNAKFSIQEISGTVTFGSNTLRHFISAFLGEFEPSGSDVFLQRQFGIKPLNPTLMTSWNGVNGTSAYPFYGLGASYAIHAGQNFAGAFYLSHSADLVAATNSLDSNLRFAFVSHNLELDATAGVCLAYNTSSSIFALDNVGFHASVTLLAGDRNLFSVFFQGGMGNLSGTSINAGTFTDSVYFFLEPRFVAWGWHFSAAAFSLPFSTIDRMTFLTYPSELAGSSSANKSSVGFNLNAYTNHVKLGSTHATGGAHLTFSIPGANIITVAGKIGAGTAVPQFTITPYFSLNIFGGTLSTALSLNVTELAKQGGGAIHLMLGLRSQL